MTTAATDGASATIFESYFSIYRKKKLLAFPEIGSPCQNFPLLGEEFWKQDIFWNFFFALLLKEEENSAFDTSSSKEIGKEINLQPRQLFDAPSSLSQKYGFFPSLFPKNI